MFHSIYHTDTINLFYRAHLLQVTRGQSVEGKAMTTIFCRRTILEVEILISAQIDETVKMIIANARVHECHRYMLPM